MIKVIFEINTARGRPAREWGVFTAGLKSGADVNRSFKSDVDTNVSRYVPNLVVRTNKYK